MEELAPIILFVYNRPDHTANTLNALMENKLANESTLYIYCDGPKEKASNIQLNNIALVREIVKSKKWCKEIFVYYSDINVGCRDSIINGITEVLAKHNSIIVLEDDILTSPSFLIYMNKALNYYKNRQSVFSISGHSHSPEKFSIPDDYDYDVFVSPRIFNWGWGTWKNRWEQTDWSMNYFDTFKSKINEVAAFNRGGDDLMKMLNEEYLGKSSAWDIQFTFAHFRNHAVSIIPIIPYTYNIGLDGTGTHCIRNEELLKVTNMNLCVNEQPKFVDNLYEDKRIINALYSAFCFKKRPLWQKSINRLCRLIGRNNIFVIKCKIYS